MARQTNPNTPIGTTGMPPLVVRTADMARFLRRHLPLTARGPNYSRMVQRIKGCKENGQHMTSVSAETLRDIYTEVRFVTADNTAEAILVAENGTDLLGKDIPLYRNPYLPTWKYVDFMKKALRKGWNIELDGLWDEDAQLAYIESFPSITPP